MEQQGYRSGDSQAMHHPQGGSHGRDGRDVGNLPPEIGGRTCHQVGRNRHLPHQCQKSFRAFQEGGARRKHQIRWSGVPGREEAPAPVG